jgi:hypothetical protein
MPSTTAIVDRKVLTGSGYRDYAAVPRRYHRSAVPNPRPLRPRRIAVVALLIAAGCGASRLEPGTIAVGTWGGDDAGLLVRADGAHAHIGCTYGDVVGPIPFDAAGRFDVAAEWDVDAFPIDRGILHPARVSGTTTGRDLTFSVVLTDAGKTLGPTAVTLGREPRMVNCPICRIPRVRARTPRPPE